MSWYWRRGVPTGALRWHFRSQPARRRPDASGNVNDAHRWLSGESLGRQADRRMCSILRPVESRVQSGHGCLAAGQVTATLPHVVTVQWSRIGSARAGWDSPSLRQEVLR